MYGIVVCMQDGLHMIVSVFDAQTVLCNVVSATFVGISAVVAVPAVGMALTELPVTSDCAHQWHFLSRPTPIWFFTADGITHNPGRQYMFMCELFILLRHKAMSTAGL